MSTAAFPLTEPPVRPHARWIPFLRSSASGSAMNLYSAFHADSASPTFVEPRSFADLRQLYVEAKAYPYVTTLYHCYASRVEYCRARDTAVRDFVVVHIRHPSAAKPIGYLLAAPADFHRGPSCKEKGDLPADPIPTNSVLIFNHHSTIRTLVGGSEFRVLLHAKLDASTCPLLYFIAAGQTLAEHLPNSAADVRDIYWPGAILFRLICDVKPVTRIRATDVRDLIALFEAPDLDKQVEGLCLQYAAEVTNIRKLMERARARRTEALAADVSAARGTMRAVEAVANTAVSAKKAAGIAIQIARKEREMRKAAEKRERQTKQAADLRERELLSQIAELKAR
ncbi:hypothetical protein OH76DRAFT_135519 [Lentinus brumalis]|uniref:Uncharacterized protein n=1 Tax=Lentinus brumalis TaxID=2498619 RepID=A0A371CPS0_9APHY|nr:hypothetical protein OH76DRAFT_135519 [Polyporus brumalis]